MAGTLRTTTLVTDHTVGIGAGVGIHIGVGISRSIGDIHIRTTRIARHITTDHLFIARHTSERAGSAIPATITIVRAWLLVVIRWHRSLRTEVALFAHRNLRVGEAHNLHIVVAAPRQDDITAAVRPIAVAIAEAPPIAVPLRVAHLTVAAEVHRTVAALVAALRIAEVAEMYAADRG